MATISSNPTTAAVDWIPSPLYRLTLEQYEAMVASGAFAPSDRFHLVNGYLVAKMTQNDPHCTADDLCGVARTRVFFPPIGTFGHPNQFDYRPRGEHAGA